MSTVVEVSHPLVRKHLTRLRDKRTDPESFRALIRRLAVLLAYEATSDLELESLEIETPICRMAGQTLAERVGLVPILRAGLGMVDPILDLVPSAEVWHLGLYRDEATAKPVEYYSKLPEVNGETIDLAPEKVYDSPFVDSEWESGVVTLRYGGEERTLKFK